MVHAGTDFGPLSASALRGASLVRRGPMSKVAAIRARMRRECGPLLAGGTE